MFGVYHLYELDDLLFVLSIGYAKLCVALCGVCLYGVFCASCVDWRWWCCLFRGDIIHGFIYNLHVQVYFGLLWVLVWHYIDLGCRLCLVCFVCC